MHRIIFEWCGKMQRIINQLCWCIIVVGLQELRSSIENKSNDAIMKEYFEAMQTEINPSINYVKSNQTSLDLLVLLH